MELATTGRAPDAWHVHLPIFDGPLDLLLHLIKVNKVDIKDIPVALICDQFHQYLALIEELSLDIAGEFIFMAAYLVHLKSKMLLPRPTRAGLSDDEADPRQDLVQRLLEYRRLKEAAQSLAETDSLRRGILPRRSSELREIAKTESDEVDLSEISLFELLRSFKQVLERFERENPAPLLLSGEMFSVRRQLERLLELLERGRPVELLDELRALSGRREAIAAFLAVLELVKMQLIRLHDGSHGPVLYRTSRDLVREELEAIQG